MSDVTTAPAAAAALGDGDLGMHLSTSFEKVSIRERSLTELLSGLKSGPDSVSALGSGSGSGPSESAPTPALIISARRPSPLRKAKLIKSARAAQHGVNLGKWRDNHRVSSSGHTSTPLGPSLTSAVEQADTSSAPNSAKPAESPSSPIRSASRMESLSDILHGLLW